MALHPLIVFSIVLRGFVLGTHTCTRNTKTKTFQEVFMSRLLRFIVVLFTMWIVLALAGHAWAGLQAEETSLSPAGMAYELNLDSQGMLWVSDASAGEIWAFDSASGAYTVYSVNGAPSDAHSDGVSAAWWADFNSNKLGRLSISTDQATIWEIPGGIGMYSIAIDSNDDVWVSDYYDSYLYRLDPGTNQLCAYALPDSGTSDYLYISGQQLWFGDTVNGRIVRLQDETFTWWNLPPDSHPRDLELDGAGQVWWTDVNKGYIGRLDSNTPAITTFTPPTSGTPVMLKLSGGKVWYSQQSPNQVVVLDPAVAASETSPVTTGSQEALPTCNELLPLRPTAVTATHGQASWSGQTYSTALDEAGWKIYHMPTDGNPWGITATDQVWLVDQGRQVLARLKQSTQIYLPLVQK
jgi:streptogramin lyase